MRGNDDVSWVEPYRVKVVEPIRLRTAEERDRLIAEAGYNPFLLEAADVYVDLLTDSGTGAMSQEQWSALMLGDESYAGSRSFDRLRDAVREVMGFPYVIPAHQGRGAEHLLFKVLLKQGQSVINNTHFDTTRAHIENAGGIAVDKPVPAARRPAEIADFKGDMDVDSARDYIERIGPGGVALLMATVTNNSAGGQPVSIKNLRAIRDLADRYGIPFYIDACRFAENAFFVKEREDGYSGRTIAEIVREMMGLADGCTMSAKKDGLANMGGFLATRDERVYREATQWAVLFEGFPTYGGLTGRDMEAVAQGLREVLDERYLRARVGQVQKLARDLRSEGIPLLEPPGGHAVYVDAIGLLPHIPREEFPAWALTVELYREAGVRAVEIGSVMAGRDPETGRNRFPDLELVRLAIPRRTYTDGHLRAVVEGMSRIKERGDEVRGLRFEYEPPFLRHFTGRFVPVS